MNSAQRLQREATQSQAVSGHGARDMADSGLDPTQILAPTQRIEDVCPLNFRGRFKLINQGPKIGNVRLNAGRTNHLLQASKVTLLRMSRS